MNKIYVLPESVQALIAAGEVIHSPRDILKELIENSLDAGAKNIEISLHYGGIEHISVIDDGVGIPAEQIELAVTRYATSKLKSADDLLTIPTYGFRGEALFTIASVTNFSLRSCTQDQKIGATITIQSPSRVPVVGQLAMKVGTHVICDQLFAPIPVRRRFLKSPGLEQKKCLYIAKALLLPHSECAVRVTDFHQLLLHIPQADPLTRLIAAFPETMRSGWHQKTFIFDHGQIHGWCFGESVKGLSQFWYCNKRWFQNPALEKLTGQYLIKGILIIEIQFHETTHIDVNIHPQKHTIGFQYQDSLMSSLRDFFNDWFGRPIEMEQMSISCENTVKTQFLSNDRSSRVYTTSTPQSSRLNTHYQKSSTSFIQHAQNIQEQYQSIALQHEKAPNMHLLSLNVGLLLNGYKVSVMKPIMWIQSRIVEEANSENYLDLNTASLSGDRIEFLKQLGCQKIDDLCKCPAFILLWLSVAQEKSHNDNDWKMNLLKECMTHYWPPKQDDWMNALKIAGAWVGDLAADDFNNMMVGAAT
ncbi:MAG: hypothetical protein FJ161_03560 [Gammaproteobacteria bacterium]|nr:hypothetical protein [Gammaproteobacteria bacterium]